MSGHWTTGAACVARALHRPALFAAIDPYICRKTRECLLKLQGQGLDVLPFFATLAGPRVSGSAATAAKEMAKISRKLDPPLPGVLPGVSQASPRNQIRVSLPHGRTRTGAEGESGSRLSA